MNEHQTETAFLKHIILYDDSEARRTLEKSIEQVRRDTLCVQRVASVMALFPMLGLAGIAYGVLLQENFPYNASELVLRILCVLGLASLICLMGFAGLWTFYFRKLHRLRKEARQLVMKTLESRLGKPDVATLPDSPRVFDVGEAFQGAMEVSGDAGCAILI